MSLHPVIWVSEETKSKRKKKTPLPQGVEDLVHTKSRQLAEAADLVEFLVVRRDPNASRLHQGDHRRAQLRRGRVQNQACCQVLVQGSLHFLGHDGIDAVRP